MFGLAAGTAACRERSAAKRRGFHPKMPRHGHPQPGPRRWVTLAGRVVIGCCGREETEAWMEMGSCLPLPCIPAPSPASQPALPPVGVLQTRRLAGARCNRGQDMARGGRKQPRRCEEEEEEEEGETEDGQSPNHSPGHAEGTGQPPAGAESGHGAAANLLPARPDPAPCTQRRAQVPPHAIPDPQCPPAGCWRAGPRDAQPRAGRRWRRSPTPARLHPVRRRIRPCS